MSNDESPRPADARSPRLADAADEGPGARPPETPAPRLSARELQVLQLASIGLSGPMIAAELTLSEATVKAHFAHIRVKLGVSDRAAAVAYAIRAGLIE